MIPKIILTDSQIHALVSANMYKVDKKMQLVSRCIDGRYESSPDLPALAIPGADIGDLAILYATAEGYGFEVDYDKALKSLQDLVVAEGMRWHTDEQGEKDLGSGCGHLKQLRLDPAAYSLNQELIDILNAQLIQAEKAGGKEQLLKGKNLARGVVIIKGEYGISPQMNLETDQGTTLMQVFVFHETLVSARHRLWAAKLVESSAVKLLDNLDEEYLYEALSNTTDEHLFETLRRLAKDLPIFQVTFVEDGSFKVKQMGVV